MINRCKFTYRSHNRVLWGSPLYWKGRLSLCHHDGSWSNEFNAPFWGSLTDLRILISITSKRRAKDPPLDKRRISLCVNFVCLLVNKICLGGRNEITAFRHPLQSIWRCATDASLVVFELAIHIGDPHRRSTLANGAIPRRWRLLVGS